MSEKTLILTQVLKIIHPPIHPSIQAPLLLRQHKSTETSDNRAVQRRSEQELEPGASFKRFDSPCGRSCSTYVSCSLIPPILLWQLLKVRVNVCRNLPGSVAQRPFPPKSRMIIFERKKTGWARKHLSLPCYILHVLWTGQSKGVGVTSGPHLRSPIST